ncbi:MAG: C45 family peptidase [archaeon]|nr:C45 family peptidase [archaeon]
MQITTFKGNYFEVGKQLGKIYKKNGMDLGSVKVNKDILENQKTIYQKYFPGVLEELKGINEILKINEEKLLFFFLAGELDWFRKFYVAKACTIFGVKNKNGSFVGRNYDWLKSTENLFEIYKIITPKKNKYISITDMGVYSNKSKSSFLLYNEDDAINDKGLFIGLDFALSYKWKYGLRPAHMIKLIAENCKTVDEALKIFKEVPLCYPKFFFIADKSGRMVVVEHNSEKVKIREPVDNRLIVTNHFVDPELKKEDKILVKYPKHNTKLRYEEVDQKIKARRDFKYSDIIEILGDTNSHTCQDKYGIKSIWSLSLEMQKQKYKLVYNLFGKKKEKDLEI